MRGRGETRKRSAWTRARKLGDAAPTTHLDPALRALCLQGEKAVSVIASPDRVSAHFGTPADPEDYVAWRVDAISIYLLGEVPGSVELRLGDAADVSVRVDRPGGTG